MKIFTAHTRPGRPPVLLAEGFSWGALILGPFWLLANRAWVAGVLALCGFVIVAAALPGPAAASVLVALAWALGLFGRDLCRWSLANAGYTLVHVVAAPDEDSALARLLERRPDLIGPALGMEVVA